MKKPDPIFLLIDKYCRSYNKENRKEIYSSWYYIPAFSAIAAVMYWKVGINGFMCSMVAIWGIVPYSRRDFEQENEFSQVKDELF